MNALREKVDRLAELDELRHGAHAWRHALATAAATFGIIPALTLVTPSMPRAIVRGGGALWSALVIGWVAIVIHGALLGRERRQLARSLAAPAADDVRRR